MEYATLNKGIKMPMAGIGTFLLTPDEAEKSVFSAIEDGYRLIDTANAYVNEKIDAMDRQKRYYISTPELLKKYESMVPPVEEQK